MEFSKWRDGEVTQGCMLDIHVLYGHVTASGLDREGRSERSSRLLIFCENFVIFGFYFMDTV